MTRDVETFRWNVLNHASPNENLTPPRTDAPATVTDDASRYKGYRVPSTRLRHWDYTTNAFYFVTICTRNHLPLLGEIVNGEVIPSEAGRIVDEEWRRTGEVRGDVQIDEYIVMPNHVHGIVVLDREASLQGETPYETPHRGVSTTRLVSDSLGSIIGQFKGACTRRIRAAGIDDFGWQPRFYDHIIRDERSLDTIRSYIADNPLKWAEDQETPENLWM